MLEDIKAISLVFGIIEKLSGREIVNRQKRFEYFEGAFLELIKIHRDHISMLRTCENILPQRIYVNENIPTWLIRIK